jgi:hypothetical protein
MTTTWLFASTTSGPAGDQEEAAAHADKKITAIVSGTVFLGRRVGFINQPNPGGKGEVSAVSEKTRKSNEPFDRLVIVLDFDAQLL